MKPETKMLAIVAGYCIVLWLTNWSFSHEYDRETGLTSSGVDLRGLGALFGLVASVVLARRSWRVVRELFEAGIRIPRSIRLWGSWSMLWLLAPLAFGTTYHSSGVASDGARMQTVFEYGGDSSWISILFSAVAIMLFQLLARLEALNPNNNAEQAGGRQPPTRRESNAGWKPQPQH